MSIIVHSSLTSSIIGLPAYRNQISYLQDIEALHMLMVCVDQHVVFYSFIQLGCRYRKSMHK